MDRINGIIFNANDQIRSFFDAGIKNSFPSCQLHASDFSADPTMLASLNPGFFIICLERLEQFTALRPVIDSHPFAKLPILFHFATESLCSLLDGDHADRIIDFMTPPLRAEVLSGRIKHFRTVIELTHKLQHEMIERGKMNVLLTDEKKYAESLINSSTDMIIAVDLERHIYEFNKRAQEIFGYTKDEILGKPVDMLYAYLDQSKCVYENTVKNKRYTAEVINRRKNGDLFPVIISASVLVEKGGKVLGTMGISRDISESKRVELELQKAKNQAETANRAKSEFLTHMSHELRTPMSSIIGFTELMRDYLADKPEPMDFLQTIERNSRHLLRMINEILDLARIESGKLTIQKDRYQTYLLVKDVYNLLVGNAVRKNININIEAQSNFPEYIYTDSTRVIQCLVNLVGNAIKFTPQGGKIHILLDFDCQGDNPNMRFHISDTGIGIAPAYLDKIMLPFERGKMADQFEGTGLGLTITKRIAALLGGDLKVSSMENSGSTFILSLDSGIESLSGIELIDLPTAMLKADKVIRDQHDSEIARHTTIRGKILLADDNPDLQKLLDCFLKRAGAEVEIAGTGKQALEYALTKEYDLIIMDMRLPELNGSEVVRELRKQGFIKPIIGLTASVHNDDFQAFLNSGCDDCALKPISQMDLVQLVRKWLKSGYTMFDPSLYDRENHSVNEDAAASETHENSPIFSSYHDDPSMHEILLGYVKGLPGKWENMMNALHRNDLDCFTKIAHGLHGSGGGFGFTLISECAEQIETQIKTDPHSQEIKALLIQFKKLIERINRAYP